MNSFKKLLINQYVKEFTNEQLAEMVIKAQIQIEDYERVIINYREENKHLKEKVNKLKTITNKLYGETKELDIPEFVLNRATDYIRYHR